MHNVGLTLCRRPLRPRTVRPIPLRPRCTPQPGKSKEQPEEKKPVAVQPEEKLVVEQPEEKPVMQQPEEKPVVEQPEEPPVGSFKGLFFGGFFEWGMDPRLFGDDVDPDVPLPDRFEKDFWEDPKFEFIGAVMEYFIPIMIVMSLVVGGIAAKSFNEGATSYLQPAASDSTSAEIRPLPSEQQQRNDGIAL